MALSTRWAVEGEEREEKGEDEREWTRVLVRGLGMGILGVFITDRWPVVVVVVVVVVVEGEIGYYCWYCY